jgi:hypothetical protein
VNASLTPPGNKTLVSMIQLNGENVTSPVQVKNEDAIRSLMCVYQNVNATIANITVVDVDIVRLTVSKDAPPSGLVQCSTAAATRLLPTTRFSKFATMRMGPLSSLI